MNFNIYIDKITDYSMTEFNVIIEKDEEEWYVASVPEIKGCYTQAKNIPELLERIKEAIEVCIESEEEKAEQYAQEEPRKKLITK